MPAHRQPNRSDTAQEGARKEVRKGVREEFQEQTDGRCGGKKRATPESGAEEALKIERARQRTAVRRMNATREDATRTADALRSLLADPAFVALLRVEGLVSLPEFVRRRLVKQP